MPRPRKYKDEDLLEKAMCLFWKKGYKNTSLKDLEKTLNLTAPSIYHSFGSKELLFIKSIDHYLSNVVDQRLTQYLKNDDQPIRNIKNFFLSLVENPEIVNSKMGCMLTNTATELGSSIPEVSTKVQEGLDKIENALHKELTLAKNHKQLNNNKNITEIASALLLSYQGLLVMLRLNYPTTKLKHFAQSALNILD